MEIDDFDIKDADMMRDIKRAFASEHKLCPDVEDELSLFWERQHAKKQKHQRIIFRSLFTSIAVAAAVLACVFILQPKEEIHKVTAPKPFFAAISDNQLKMTTNGKKSTSLNINGENIKVSKPVAQEMNTIKTPSGKFFTLLLPDGTTVKLNAQSTFSFPSKFSNKNREVYLKGEAYFDVHHDPSHPFIVKTDYFEAKAVGTSFDVRSYDAHQASVTLVEGKLLVGNAKQEPSLLRPNQQSTLNADGTLSTSNTDTYQYKEWTNGTFYFDDVTLSEVLKEMGRWYNINIEVHNKGALSTKLHFVADRNASIQEAIKNLNALGHFNIVKEKNRIVVE